LVSLPMGDAVVYEPTIVLAAILEFLPRHTVSHPELHRD